MFANLKIRWKFLFSSYLVMFLAVLLIAFFVISSLRANAQRDIESFRQEELNKVKANLKNYVDMAYGLIEAGHQSSGAAAIDKIKLDVGQMRYDQGTGYFWINDTGRPYPRMVMHPTVPDLNGKILDDPKYNCALGKKENLFKAFVEVTARGGEGFVDYLWPKPTKDGLTSDQPKLSFVRIYKPLDWIIGTGVYIDDIEKTVAAKTASINHQIRNLLIKIVLIAAVIALLSLAGLWFLAQKISDPINACANFSSQLGAGNLDADVDLDESRDEVGLLAASLKDMRDNLRSSIANITQVSVSLSDGASDQASSLEETSSSLEEMSAMTRQNAENANMGNRLIEESRAIVTQANSAMSRLAEAMKDISKASQETQKIIKTIDEIAFQTNLLALNAAVEAARAGEAGAGFAVVADEVRNLAMRAAEAAKVTARLIEDTVKKIGEGDALATSTNAVFNEVTQNIHKVSQFMNEIVQASDEQAKGIEQINQTVANINNVTQNNVSLGHELIAAANVFEVKDNHNPGSVLPYHRK